MKGCVCSNETIDPLAAKAASAFGTREREREREERRRKREKRHDRTSTAICPEHCIFPYFPFSLLPLSPRPPPAAVAVAAAAVPSLVSTRQHRTIPQDFRHKRFILSMSRVQHFLLLCSCLLFYCTFDKIWRPQKIIRTSLSAFCPFATKFFPSSPFRLCRRRNTIGRKISNYDRGRREGRREPALLCCLATSPPFFVGEKIVKSVFFFLIRPTTDLPS